MPLTHILNFSLQKGVAELKIAKIIRVYKDPAIFNHDRPISVLPVMAKVFV